MRMINRVRVFIAERPAALLDRMITSSCSILPAPLKTDEGVPTISSGVGRGESEQVDGARGRVVQRSAPSRSPGSRQQEQKEGASQNVN
jgi:hypothetical protein